MAEKKATTLSGGITDRLNELAEKIKGKLPGDLVKDAAESLSTLTRDTGKLAAAESLTAARTVVRAQKKLVEQALSLLDTMSKVPEKVSDRLTAEKSALPPEAKTILKQWTALTRDTRRQFRQTLLDSFEQTLSGLERAEKELKAGTAKAKSQVAKTSPQKTADKTETARKAKPAAGTKKTAAPKKKAAKKPPASSASQKSQEG